MRVQFDEQRRSEMRKTSFQPTEGKPQGGLKPWREVVTPHPDVASGRYQQAEFAADLWQVYQEEGSDEYKHPTEFFRRTFLTEGLRRLLATGAGSHRRQGGDPVVELANQLRRRQDAFDAGAVAPVLRHGGERTAGRRGTGEGGRRARCQRTSAGPFSSARRFLPASRTRSRTAPWSAPSGARSPGSSAARKATSWSRKTTRRPPTPAMRSRSCSTSTRPCLILIDEWVAYARQLHEGSDLPAGTFDTQFTFAQAFSEAAKAAKQTLLVVSVPSSDNEIGGEWGQKALARLEERHRPRRSILAAGQPGRGFRDRPPPAVPAAHRRAGQTRDAVARAFSNCTARSSRNSRPNAGKPITNAGSRWPTPSTRSCSTGSTTTGPRSTSSSGPAACCG